MSDQRERDRRLDARVSDQVVQVEYVVPSPRVRDLSVSGLYLADSRPLQRGQAIELRLRLGNAEPILIRGMVRRVDPGAGMAIEFIQVDTAGRRRIKEFVTQANPNQVSPAGDDIFS